VKIRGFFALSLALPLSLGLMPRSVLAQGEPAPMPPAYGKHALSAVGDYSPEGARASTNIKLVAHIPMGGWIRLSNVEIEQELSRPFAYLSMRYDQSGVDIVNLKEGQQAKIIYTWRIENPALHLGVGGRDGKYFKLHGRYYYVQTFQFNQGGADVDLGAVVFDVTGLPNPALVKIVGRMFAKDTPGGFHNGFMYKHSDGRALYISTTVGNHANIYDMELFLKGDTTQGLIGRIPIPASDGMSRSAAYHDFYVAYDPTTHQDKFYGSGAGGYYVYDISHPEDAKLLVAVTGVSGVTYGHTFTPDPLGRFAISETEYQYAPLRVFDLKPNGVPFTGNISRPIGAWSPAWHNLVHNHEVRWPYVFTSAYEDGLQVFNMMDPTNPVTVGFYDTFEGMHKQGLCGDLICNGAFGVDVRNADGLIVISDMTTGFWAFKMEGFDGWNGHDWGMPNISSAQDWDNGPEGAPKPAKPVT
jgi:hypothetical protein